MISLIQNSAAMRLPFEDAAEKAEKTFCMVGDAPPGLDEEFQNAISGSCSRKKTDFVRPMHMRPASMRKC